MPADLTAILKQIRSLLPDDRERLKGILKREPSGALSPRDARDWALHEAGLLTMPSLPPDLEGFESYLPITVTGEPVSETIINERR